MAMMPQNFLPDSESGESRGSTRRGTFTARPVVAQGLRGTGESGERIFNFLAKSKNVCRQIEVGAKIIKVWK